MAPVPPPRARPRDCSPGYAGPAFLDATAAALGTRGGFIWTFHPRPPPEAAASVSASSLAGYALLAVRAEPSAGANVCGDSTKPDQAINVCSFDGREFDHPGVCPATCIWHSWSFEPFDESKVMGPRK